jgi:hypothetical protein
MCLLCRDVTYMQLLLVKWGDNYEDAPSAYLLALATVVYRGCKIHQSFSLEFEPSNPPLQVRRINDVTIRIVPQFYANYGHLIFCGLFNDAVIIFMA